MPFSLLPKGLTAKARRVFAAANWDTIRALVFVIVEREAPQLNSKSTRRKKNRLMNDAQWSWTYDRVYFQALGAEGGSKRTPKKLEAARRNLAKANIARLAAKAHRQREAAAASVPSQELAPPPPTISCLAPPKI